MVDVHAATVPWGIAVHISNLQGTDEFKTDGSQMEGRVVLLVELSYFRIRNKLSLELILHKNGYIVLRYSRVSSNV